MNKKSDIKKFIDKLILVILVIILVSLIILLGQKIYKETTKPTIRNIYLDSLNNNIILVENYINIKQNNGVIQLKLTDKTIFNTLYMSEDCKSIEDLENFLNVNYEISINYDANTNEVTYIGIYHSNMETSENV